MSGCNTDGCKQIQKFVRELIGARSDLTWYVFEEANSLDVFVRVIPEGREAQTLRVENGFAKPTAGANEEYITRWIDALLNPSAEGEPPREPQR
jgi:hypothetical protein